jgi:hypothetical protein
MEALYCETERGDVLEGNYRHLNLDEQEQEQILTLEVATDAWI